MINQLQHLQQTLGVSYLFIGHDLATVAHISHRIAVMYLGQIELPIASNFASSRSVPIRRPCLARPCRLAPINSTRS
jgi:ABC-type dipeptide/oligopeptide/nickel transport system ATPase subunit